MIIFPAIDLIDGKAVRLLRGDYAQKKVYNADPAAVALGFAAAGATHIHIVDLDGAKSGDLPNFGVVREIKKRSGLFCEIGGGIRTMESIEKYLSAGIDRVILGTAAVADPGFLAAAVGRYGEKIAVGADIRDGHIAVKGWTERSDVTLFEFARRMEEAGVKTLICTDISKDGAMQGVNLGLYRSLKERFSFDLTASGGVSSHEDLAALKNLGVYGAIIGKAYYEGAIDLKKAIEEAL